MLSLQNTETIVTALLLLSAYAISITLVEAIQAWYAFFMGDDSAAREGWTSLNPLDHVDTLGTLLVVFLGVGWVRSIPINPASMRVSIRDMRLAFVYFAQPLVSTMLALAALSILVVRWGVPVLTFAVSMFLHHSVPLSSFAAMHPDKSSFEIVGALFLIALVTYNVFIASIGFIAHGFRYALMRMQCRHNGAISALYTDESTRWILIFIILIFFAPFLRSLLFGVVAKSAIMLGHLLGMV